MRKQPGGESGWRCCLGTEPSDRAARTPGARLGGSHHGRGLGERVRYEKGNWPVVQVATPALPLKKRSTSSKWHSGRPCLDLTWRATQERASDICLDTSPPPIQSGCACRGDGGLTHVDCLVQLAASQQAYRRASVWRQCKTCKQDFTGAMLIGLAGRWLSLYPTVGRFMGQPREKRNCVANGTKMGRCYRRGACVPYAVPRDR
jgi:hypothetical protein